MSIYWVRCNPSPSGKYQASVWGSQGKGAKPIDSIDVDQSTNIFLKTDDEMSEMKQFSITVSPNNLVEVTPTSKSQFEIQLYDRCKDTDDVYVWLAAVKNNNIYYTDSGKPIIRNRPAEVAPLPNRQFAVIALVILAAVCVLAIGRYVFGWW